MQKASPNGLPVVYVGRPTKWGNPWRVGMFRGFTRQDAIDSFRKWASGKTYNNVSHWGNSSVAMHMAARRELRGKNLACFCPLDQPCHADVLLELANGD